MLVVMVMLIQMSAVSGAKEFGLVGVGRPQFTDKLKKFKRLTILKRADLT